MSKEAPLRLPIAASVMLDLLRCSKPEFRARADSNVRRIEIKKKFARFFFVTAMMMNNDHVFSALAA